MQKEPPTAIGGPFERRVDPFSAVYAVRVTVGWTDKGKQIQKYLGFYAKKSETIEALAEYNQHPYDIGSTSVTFAEVYQKWTEKRFPDGEVPFRPEFSSILIH